MDLSDLAICKPLIAAVNGHCLGAGLEVALQCDIRIASTNASFGLPEATVGSIPAVSGLHRLLKAVPSGARDADGADRRAHRCASGAAHRPGLRGVGSRSAARSGLRDRAQRIAANAPLAVQAIKKLSRQTAHLSDADAQQLTELYWGVLRDTHDRIEGRAAFAEKRTPTYSGR